MTQTSSASDNAGRFNHLVSGNPDHDQAYYRTSPDFLGVIIDVDPAIWSKRKNGIQFLQKAIQDICIFLNAHTALRHDNCCTVYAAGRSNGKLIFSNTPSLSFANRLHSDPDANTYQTFKIIDDAIMQGIKNSLDDGKDDLSTPASHGIVSSLAQCLCQINRLGKLTLAASGIEDDPKVSASINNKSNAGRGYRSRILVISASPDSSSQYVAMMNCIFGAQKKGVTVDVCKILGGDDSVFLQQACHLTKGNYYRLDVVEGLLQTLMTTFLASPSIRDQMRLPSNDDVDFRAACFCHGRVVDIGYVCSVCLSIFCEPRDKCLTCRAAFPKRTLQRFQEEQKSAT